MSVIPAATGGSRTGFCQVLLRIYWETCPPPRRPFVPDRCFHFLHASPDPMPVDSAIGFTQQRIRRYALGRVRIRHASHLSQIGWAVSCNPTQSANQSGNETRFP